MNSEVCVSPTCDGLSVLLNSLAPRRYLRVGFDPVATSEPSPLLETQESGMEEGRGGQLELTPLTQSNSLDDVDDDDDADEHLAELLRERSEERSSAGATVSTAADGDGSGHRGIVPDSKGRRASSAWDKSIGGGINNPSNDRVTLGDESETASKIDDDRYGVGNSFGDGGSNRNSSGDRFLQPSREAPSGGASLSSAAGRSETLGFASSTNGNRGHGNSNPTGRRSHIGDDLGNRVIGFSTDDGGDASCAAGESQSASRVSAVWREVLVPVRLLEEKRVRAILFVYGIYSVSEQPCPFLARCLICVVTGHWAILVGFHSQLSFLVSVDKLVRSPACTFPSRCLCVAHVQDSSCFSRSSL